MISAVFDTNIFVSAFLTRYRPRGLTTELLRLVQAGSVRLFISPAIVREIANTLLRSERMRRRYDYTPGLVAIYCADLLRAPNIEVIDDPPATPGAVPTDPDDDKIVACAAAGNAAYLVTRDPHLLTLCAYGTTTMITPESFIHLVRTQSEHP